MFILICSLRKKADLHDWLKKKKTILQQKKFMSFFMKNIQNIFSRNLTGNQQWLKRMLFISEAAIY